MFQQPHIREVEEHHALQDIILSPGAGDDKIGSVPASSSEPDGIASQGMTDQPLRTLHHGDVVLRGQSQPGLAVAHRSVLDPPLVQLDQEEHQDLLQASQGAALLVNTQDRPRLIVGDYQEEEDG